VCLKIGEVRLSLPAYRGAFAHADHRRTVAFSEAAGIMKIIDMLPFQPLSWEERLAAGSDGKQ